jgi:hypothetical protein
MAAANNKVTVTADAQSITLVKGTVAAALIVKLAGNPYPGAKVRYPALNQIFSAKDNITCNGGESFTTSLL